ncbi:MAG TPA: adenylate/guanylate cyclase domain-containing protein [bacterium]|nr:adenylate/guanylate cyclase domain-containing protein [bacterium]
MFAAGLFSVGVLEFRLSAREIERTQKNFASESRKFAARLDGEFDGYLGGLGAVEQDTVLLGQLEAQLRARGWSEAQLRTARSVLASEGDSGADPTTPVLVLSSAQRAERLRLTDSLGLILQQDVTEGHVSWISVDIARAHNSYVVARASTPSHPLAFPNEEAPAAEAALEATLTDGKPRETEPFHTGRASWISAFAPIHAKDGKVIAVVEVSDGVDAILDQRTAAMRALVIEAAATVVLGGLVSLLALRPLSRRLERLRDAIETVKTGRLDVDLPVTGNDEVDALAAAFNGMTHELREKDRMRAVLVQTLSHEVAQEMLSGKPDLEGAEREASVLFADVRGFTSLSEGMSAREVIRLLNDYFERISPPVEKFGGVVDKFLGDGMLAMFGAPVPVENDALAAVKAAVAMQEALRALNSARVAEGKPQIETGIGVNTGSVVTGTLGSKERRNFTVLGATVNIASRLCGQAGPGQIVISQATYLRVKNRVDVRPLEPLTLKGITFPVQAFEVLGIRETTAG